MVLMILPRLRFFWMSGMAVVFVAIGPATTHAGQMSSGGINPPTINLSCEFSDIQTGHVYRLKLTDDSPPSPFSRVELYQKSGDQWLDLSAKTPYKATPAIYRFAGVTTPGIPAPENERVLIGYGSVTPSGTMLSLRFDATKRQPDGSYETPIFLKTLENNSATAIRGDGICFADVFEPSDPFVVESIP